MLKQKLLVSGIVLQNLLHMGWWIPILHSRALSVPQEQAQLLSGPHLPEGLIKALLAGSSVGQQVTRVNLSPYDAWVERVCMKWHVTNPEHQISSLSLSSNLGVVTYSEKICAMTLLEDSGI